MRRSSLPGVIDSTAVQNMDGMGWAEIDGYPGYRVTPDGRVWTSKLGAGGGWRELRTAMTGGYRKVTLSHRNQPLTVHVHRLVASAFLGPRPAGQVVRHLDGDLRNNRLSNLSYGTFEENEADKERHGRRPVGAAVYGSRLTADKVREARIRFAAGERCTDLAKEFGVAKVSMFRALHGLTWKHLPTPDYSGRPDSRHHSAPGELCPVAKLTKKQVLEIREAASDRSRWMRLANQYAVSFSNVRRIAMGITWRHLGPPVYQEREA